MVGPVSTCRSMAGSKPVLRILRLALETTLVSLSPFIGRCGSHVWLDRDPSILLSLVHQGLMLLLNLISHGRDDGVVRLGGRE